MKNAQGRWLFRLVYSRIIVLENAQCGTDHVVELPAVGHLEEHPDRKEDDSDAEGNEEVKGFHFAIAVQ